MKVPIYVRVARDPRSRYRGLRADGHPAYDSRPLTDPDGHALHTVFMRVTLDIPDELLRPTPMIDVDASVEPPNVGWARVVEIEAPPAPEPEEVQT